MTRRGFWLSGDNALAALEQTMRSRMRADESRHRIVGTDDYQRAKADTAAGAGPAGSSADAASSPPSSPVADAATRKGAGPLTPPQRRPNSADGAPLYPLVGMCRAAGLPEPVPEYQFHPRRKWRIDFAWPMQRIGLEIEGGIWSEGRHTRGAGFLADMAKYNTATMLGWRLLRYAPDQLGQALDDLRIMFAGDAA